MRVPVVFFDMDETLLHAEAWVNGENPIDPRSLFHRGPRINVMGYHYTVNKRPGIDAVLLYLQHKMYPLYVYTAADLSYAELALEALNLRPYFLDVFSTRSKEPRGTLSYWYLFDDTAAEHKVRHLSRMGPGELVPVYPFYNNLDVELIDVPRALRRPAS